MFCEKCGKQLGKNARFCGYCGAAVISQKVCPACRQEMETDMLYCSSCGTKLDAAVKTNAVVSSGANGDRKAERNTFNTNQNAVPKEVIVSGENRLAEVKLVWYQGEVKLGVSKAEGVFSVYRDRIEYKKTMGASTAYAFGFISMAVSASKVKKEEPVVFWMSEIAGVKEGKYMGMFPALILEMKNGEKHTFAGVMQEEQIRTCITFIQRYI